jgi:hypothetical protein
MSDEPHRFRFRPAILLPAYLVFFQFLALIASLCLLAIRGDFTGPGAIELVLALSTLATLSAVARTAVVAAWHRIEVGPAGIRARPRDERPVPWDTIHTARITRWLVLSYLELEVPGGKPARFPLYLTDLPGFADAVEAFAGENHPLTWALREWLQHDAD